MVRCLCSLQASVSIVSATVVWGHVMVRWLCSLQASVSIVSATAVVWGLCDGKIAMLSPSFSIHCFSHCRVWESCDGKMAMLSPCFSIHCFNQPSGVGSCDGKMGMLSPSFSIHCFSYCSGWGSCDGKMAMLSPSFSSHCSAVIQVALATIISHLHDQIFFDWCLATRGCYHSGTRCLQVPPRTHYYRGMVHLEQHVSIGTCS